MYKFKTISNPMVLFIKQLCSLLTVINRYLYMDYNPELYIRVQTRSLFYIFSI